MEEDNEVEIQFSQPVEDFLTKQSSKCLAKRDDYLKFPHFLIPSLIQHSKVENITSESIAKYAKFSYRSTHCVPFGSPALLDEANVRAADPTMKLVVDKMNWSTAKHKIISASAKSKGRQVAKTGKRSTRNVYPGTIALANHFELDPDPNFSGHYNWYYTGGCLSTVIGSNSFLLVNGCHTGFLSVTPVKVIENDITPDTVSTSLIEVNRNDPILQIVTTEHYLGVRQKHCAHLFAIKECKKYGVTIKSAHKGLELEESIVCIAVSPESSGEYCTLISPHTLKFWCKKLDDFKKIVKLKTSDVEDNWGLVKYLSKERLLTSDRYKISLRNKEGQVAYSDDEFNVKPCISDCDYITNVILSISCSDKVYVVTKHSVLELNFRSGFERKWTHMMEYPPLFGFTEIMDENEVVFLGSQNTDEVCAIETHLENMPYLLSTPNETLNKARLKGLCLDLDISLRFELSLVGIVGIDMGSAVYIFRCTSVGDVFCQKFMQNIGDYNETLNYDLLRKWDNECKQAVHVSPYNRIKVTDKRNFSEVWKRTLDSVKRSEQEENIKDDKPWMLPKSKILKFKDPLAACLLEAWELEDDEEMKVHKEDTNRGVANVESWLGKIGTSEEPSFFVDKCGSNDEIQIQSDLYDVKSWLGEVTGYYIDKNGAEEVFVKKIEEPDTLNKNVESEKVVEDSGTETPPSSGFYIDRTGSSEMTENEGRSQVHFNESVNVMEYEAEVVPLTNRDHETPLSSRNNKHRILSKANQDGSEFTTPSPKKKALQKHRLSQFKSGS